MVRPLPTPPAGDAIPDRGGPLAVDLDVEHGPRFRLRIYWPHPPELRCPKCGDWHPITPEFWHLNQWSECRTCHAGRQALASWLRWRTDALFRNKELARARAYKKLVREEAPHLYVTLERERKAKQRTRLRKWRQRGRAA